MSMVPTSTGIGAPGTDNAPANLSRSPMAAQPGQQQSAAVPFTRGSTLATYYDSATTIAFAASSTVQLQTNAFLEFLLLDVTATASGNASTNSVTFTGADQPWGCISQLFLNDPANQAIIAPITGYGLYLLNKYGQDTGCSFDPVRDPNYSTTTGTGAAAGSFSFRVVVPIENRRRDAFGALNNSAANQRYLLGITTAAAASVYGTTPSTVPSIVFTITQAYWTSPPTSITTSSGTVAVQPTPTGLSTVGFVRYERHNEVSGGGTPQIQLNNVGDYLSAVFFVLRNSSSQRDGVDWPGGSNEAGGTFQWWVNDYQVHNLGYNFWQWQMARFFGYYGGINAQNTNVAGCIDLGVFILPWLWGLFDKSDNYSPANQYLPTDATTKLQVRGSTFASGSSFLEVYTRAIRPYSGMALFG